jgi:excisionase family DNA binding protein
MPNLQDYLSIKEAAEFLGVSPGTLRNWGRDGKLAVHRNPINGYRLFKKDELSSLLKNIERPWRPLRNGALAGRGR